MKLIQILLLSSLLAIVSCSKGSKKSSQDPAMGDSMESEADFIVDAEDEQLIIEDEPLMAESMGSESVEPILLDESMASAEILLSEEEASYTVMRGETLMMVAFKVYGDYRKWKDIGNMNGVAGSSVAEGTVLRYKRPTQEFIWNPEGLPYLIKRGDSLVSISSDKYGTTNKWKLIYNNNRPLIKDPNLIFAGFTLYYIPERDIASE